MKIVGIYKIQSKIKPERIYIGSAIDINQRWKLHLSQLKYNRHHSIKLQRHYNKYGKSDLEYSLLLGCEKEDLIKVEQYFLDSYNCYFNNCKNAGSRLGYKCTNETLIKMSIAKKNISSITRERMRKSHVNKKQSIITIEKRSSKNRGQKRTEETKLILIKTLRPFKKGFNKKEVH